MMDALVLIALRHPDKRNAVAGFVRNFRRHCKDEQTVLLIGWMEAVAGLGLAEMEPELRATFEAGLIPGDYRVAHEDLSELKSSAEAGGIIVNPRYKSGLITDAIEELSKWHGYSDAYLARQKRQGARNASRAMPWAETFMHETPPVGSNDPCPCGSGKKFKKFCLQ